MTGKEASVVYAAGGNYRVNIERRVAVCHVMKRADVTREMGAGFAREKIAIFQQLAKEPVTHVCGVVLDLSAAPTSWGPTTHAALIAMLACIARVRRRVAIVPAEDDCQKLQVWSLLAESVTLDGQMFQSVDAGISWVLQGG